VDISDLFNVRFLTTALLLEPGDCSLELTILKIENVNHILIKTGIRHLIFSRSLKFLSFWDVILQQIEAATITSHVTPCAIKPCFVYKQIT